MYKLYVDGNLYGEYDEFYNAKKTETNLRISANQIGHRIITVIV